ncbi:type IV pilus biogenesis protein PilM [Methylovorus glucosotrophus]|uniref:PilM inner membrane family protein n=1 Tax=Methylovorus glucosotrophus (strain SIP3-4) TaxID=582744 RepID=C6XET6_METGS|nr:type IV pilus biogenesis protein PilM [Methylovorus glucosotrophus]ACT52143.1 PilM inner membrane family protein [Methylovorus glucosotrophus SIP3-4]
MIGTLFIGFFALVTVPAEQAQRSLLVADVVATNFLTYRASVVEYTNAHPSASGTINDSSLTFKLGYIRDPRWTNTIQSNTLYIYSSTTLEPRVKEVVFNKTRRNLSSGIKGSSGRLISPNGIDTGIVLPASIPTGAITMVGD